MYNITEKEIEKIKSFGYSADLLPKTKTQRNWGLLNYFTLWQGSVHNVPNYITVGGFLTLGLSIYNVMLAVALSGFIIAFVIVLNGHSGSKYGVPFSMILRASYGTKGALLPGILRGLIAAIMWFGLQNFLGSTALYILIAKIWPGFIHIGDGATLSGINYPRWVTFILFCLANVAIGFGGGNAIKRFTAILNPCIYIVFGGMTIWAIKVAGFNNIVNYVPETVSPLSSGYPVFIFFFIMNALVAVWAGPAVSASDFTQSAKSFPAQAIGQTLGLGIAYILFAVSSVCILSGASIYYGTETWDILHIIQRWDTRVVAILAALIITMTTISTNATGNIVPAAYQIISMFRKLSYKQGVIIASIVSILILPWKLVEKQDSIFAFLEIIGGMLGPVIGVMLAHYFIAMRTKIDLSNLYIDTKSVRNHDSDFNIQAFIITVIAIFVSLGGKFIPAMQPLAQLSFFVGIMTSFILYAIFAFFKFKNNTN